MKSILFCCFISLLSLSSGNCQPKIKCPPSEIESAKTDLLNLMKGKCAYCSPTFEVFEDNEILITVLKMKRENESIKTDAKSLKDGVPLGAIRLKNKKKNQTDTYQTVLTAKDTSISVRIINVANKKEEKIILRVC